MQKAEKSTSYTTIRDLLRQKEIIIPPDFSDKIIGNSMKNYGGELPTVESIEAVLKMCDYWKKFCADENEFSKLVCTKVYSMVRLHAAAITSNQKDETCYIGKICSLKEGVALPQFITTTSATYGGTVAIQQGFGELLAE